MTSFTLKLRREHYERACKAFDAMRTAGEGIATAHIACFCPLTQAAMDEFPLATNVATSLSFIGFTLEGKHRLWVARRGESRDLHARMVNAFDNCRAEEILSLLESERVIHYERPLSPSEVRASHLLTKTNEDNQ